VRRPGADVPVPRQGGPTARDRSLLRGREATAALCHGVCALLDVELSDGSRLLEGKTITGFANVEEDFGDAAVGKRVMPFRIEDEARKRGANYVQAGLFKAFAIRDNQLITGQQQYSGGKVARLVIESLGV
jgi:putative intracellular protease/amidase